jgi:hypothetical protein
MMGFRPYFADGVPPRSDRDGFIRVRVSDRLKPTGYVAVYLASGTEILVVADEVLSFEPEDRATIDAVDDSVRLRT